MTSEQTSPTLKWYADLCMLGVASIWGFNMPIMKFALSRVDEYLFNAMRLLISAAVLGAIVYWQKAKLIDRSGTHSVKRQALTILVFGLVTGFCYQVLFLLGIDRTSAGNTALIMSSLPVWTAILATLLIKERLNRYAWLGLMVALMGTLIVTLTVPASGSRASGSLVGNLIVSAAAFSWAVGSVWSRPLMKILSPLGLAFWGVAVAVPLHFLVAIPSLDQVSTFFRDPWLLASLLYSGGFSTGLAYAMWNFGVSTLGTSHAAIFQNLVPFIALFSSWLLLSEIPGYLQLVGGCITLCGLVVMRRNRN